MKKIFQFVGGGLFFFMTFSGLYSVVRMNTRKKIEKSVDEQANDYFPVQSPSERAAGHPLVGTA